jgi:hypothetical protein
MFEVEMDEYLGYERIILKAITLEKLLSYILCH